MFLDPWRGTFVLQVKAAHYFDARGKPQGAVIFGSVYRLQEHFTLNDLPTTNCNMKKTTHILDSLV